MTNFNQFMAGKRFVVLTLLAFFDGVNATAAELPTVMAHDHMVEVGTKTSQPGQAAFGAVQEVVAILESDPTTDWLQVNVDELRAHLLDMDEVFMRAEGRVTVVDDEVRIFVTGTGKTLNAVQRMIPAHAAMMNGYRNWRSSAVQTQDGALWTIRTPTASEHERIKVLGMFGLLTLGSHHGPHHLAIARGQKPHVHP